MYQPRQAAKPSRRQAMILLVVIVLLTMFAVIGIAFVFYSGSEATSSRIFRESVGTQYQPDQSPSVLLNFFLGQLIYDLDDNQGGAASSMRGLSLSRNMYGWDYDSGQSNNNAYNGIGRLHYTYPATSPLNGQDSYNLVNSMYYSSDGFVMDPERVGTRSDPTRPQTDPYVGANAPYTYPDNNSMYLAAVAADGTVLEQSFFRPNPQFTSLDPSQANWQTPGVGKYYVLRPRPAENPNFPLPVSAGGDVKNLAGSPGTLVKGQLYNEDSFWMDLGYPVRQAPDGTLYKALFAALVVDLDNRINLNAVGNIRASARNGGNLAAPFAHGSNQGWGRWEMNPGWLLNQNGSNNQPEWFNLLLGNGSPTLFGRYGPDGEPTSSGNSAAAGTTPFFYGQVDYDGGDEVNGGVSGPYQLPQAGVFSPFPTFPNGSAPAPAGWGDGDVQERTNHPSLYDYFSPQGDDTSFSVANMQGLLVNMGQQASTTTIGQLSPNNFANPTDPASIRRRNLVTTTSSDLDRPAIVPWIFDSSTGGFQWTWSTANPTPATGSPPNPPYPQAGAVPFPTASSPLPTPTTPDEFGTDWRALDAALGKLDLDQYLPPYPAPDPNSHQFNFTGANGPANLAAFQAAVTARQSMALAIFTRLVFVTGAMNPATTGVAPTQQQFDALRWLAQLSANIVDYVDSDDYMTPFPWVALTAGAAGNTTFTQNLSTQDPIGQGVVFGTETPRAVINEVYSQIENDQNYATNGLDDINFWVELLNPYNTDPMADENGAVLTTGAMAPGGTVRLQVPQPVAGGGPTPVYQIVIAQDANKTILGGQLSSDLRAPNNALGSVPTADQSLIMATLNNWTPSTAPNGYDANVILPNNGNYTANGNTLGASVGGTNANGFYVVGPLPSQTAKAYPGFPGAASGAYPVPTNQPANGGMNYQVSDATAPAPATTTHMILLQRLANPYMPWDGTTTDNGPTAANPNTGYYNPWVTVDYVDQIPLQDARLKVTGGGATFVGNYSNFHSYGKTEPFASSAAAKQVVAQAPNPAPPNPEPQHTFFRHNGVENNNPQASTNGQTLQIPFDWLPQPDRQLISTMELLEVSGYHPHELTQQFVQLVNVNGTPTRLANQQTAPWLDQTARIYRLLEFLECHDRMAGIGVGGRHVGKININTIWDPEGFYALCDPQGANHFTQADVQSLYQTLMSSRTVGGQQQAPNGNKYYVPNVGGASSPDMPFWPLSAPFTAASPGTQYPNGSGLGNTLLRIPTGSTFTLLTPPSQGNVGTNPYVQNELLAKIANNITTRSNTFAVFLTVGFFQVTNPSATPPTIGQEIGASQNRQIRHQMFAIIDRTQLTLDQANPQLGGSLMTGSSFTTYNSPANPQYPPAGTTPMEADVAVTPTPGAGQNLSGTITTNNAAGGNLNNATGAGQITWSVQPGMSLVVDTGRNQEVVQVELVNNTANANNNVNPPLAANSFRAKFQRAHGANGTTFPITILGNPGPQPLFDYTSATYAPVVPYYVILQ